MTYRRLMGLVVLVAASLTSAKLMLAQEPPRVKAVEKTAAKDALVNRAPAATAAALADAPKGTIIAGTFEGTFSVGKSRVVAGRNATALVLAHLSPEGRAHWMQSYDGLAPGRAVALIQLPGGGAAVAGVFKGKFNLDVPKQKEFNSGDADGLFVAMVTARGRVPLARVLGMAGQIAAPSLSYQSDRLVIEVPYRGTLAQVPYKPFPTPKPGPGILQLEVSREGKVLSAKIVKTMKGAEPDGSAPGGMLRDAPGGVVPGAAPATDKAKSASAPPPAPPKTMAMLAAGVCNVCVADAPLLDPACLDCRTRVCTDDGDVWCCLSGWDRQCMNEAMSGTCPATAQRACECPHATGAAGIWMYHQCQRPGAPSCAHDVCTMDTWCTYNSWDGQCVDEGNATCGGA